MSDYTRWETPRLQARIWDCDDDCDCHQAQIDRVTPNREAGYPWIRRERIWQGTYASFDGGVWPEGMSYEQLEVELRQGCEANGIPWDQQRFNEGWPLERDA
jgi:hypothetical protein